MELSERTENELMTLIAAIGDRLPNMGDTYTPDNTIRIALYVLRLICNTGNDHKPSELLEAAVVKVGMETHGIG